MGRPLRIFLPGYAYHVIARGNERKNIFRDDIDRKKLFKIVEEAKKEFQFVVLSYVLMSNHYHFLVEIKQPNLSQIMQYINSSYSIYFNRKYKRSGHLFQGRFKAVIVEHGQDLKYVAAYIHLNPARAGMVQKLIEYPWSSHRHFTGGVDKGLAEPEYVLKYFSKDRSQAVKKYEEYVKQTAMESDDDSRKRIYGEYVMGSESFIRDVKMIFKDKKLPQGIADRKKLRKVYGEETIIEAVKKYYKVNKEELFYKQSKWNAGKRTLIFLLKRDAGMTYAGIARLLGDIDSSGLGRVYKRVKIELEKSGKARKTINEIERGYA